MWIAAPSRIGRGVATLGPVCVVLLLAPFAAAAESPIGVTPEIDLVQQEIAAHKELKAAAVSIRTNPFPALVREYFRSFEPYLHDGQPYSIETAEGWREEYGRRHDLLRRFEQDMREWHPIFSLTVIETILHRAPAGMYVMMLDLDGAGVDAAIDLRQRERADVLRAANMPAAIAERTAEVDIFHERARLWEVLADFTEHNIIRVLVQCLQTDTISHRLNVVERVTRVLETITRRDSYERFEARVREGGGSLTLPEAIHDATERLLTDPFVYYELKARRFEQLLELYVILQNRASLDYLLLLFDRFDTFDRRLGDAARLFDEHLNRATLRFIDASVRRDPEAELALEVVDQMTRWIVSRLRVVYPGVKPERIVHVLLELRHRHPRILEAYVERFYRDFHALNPAGYESVVLHLVSLMLRFAKEGDYVLLDPRDPEAEARPTGPPAHGQIMELLRWYDSTLEELAPTLPAIEIDFVDEEQKLVLHNIYACFDAAFDRSRPGRGRIDPRFVETLLHMVKRIALAADPDDIRDRVIEPLAKNLSVSRDPALAWRKERATGPMKIYLRELVGILERAGTR